MANALLERREPIDEADRNYHPLLGDLQCNILSSHGRPNTHYFFLHFNESDPGPVRALIRRVSLGQLDDVPPGLGLQSELRSRARRARGAAWATGALGIEPVTFSTNLLLTATCYKYFLGRPTKPVEEAFADAAFLGGMAGRDASRPQGTKLNDPDFAQRGFDAHALYTVGYDPEEVRWPAVRGGILQFFAKNGVKVREEAGYVLRHPQRGYPIEPFGYRDSISQPLFYAHDLRSRQTFEGEAASMSDGKWSSFATPSVALVQDPNVASEQACGSYVVYRKLRQNVAGFYEQAARLARETVALRHGDPLSTEEVADRLIGRRVDGHTLDPGDSYNDFTYPNQSVCPAYAHARKVNPRDGYARGRRIVRRSTVYGPRLRRRADGRPMLYDGLPMQVASEQGGFAADDVGLMFLCCQASIVDQFEAIQGLWANKLHGGADTVIGQTGDQENRIGLSGSGLRFHYDPVVELLEGEYFFAPSLPFFFNL